MLSQTCQENSEDLQETVRMAELCVSCKRELDTMKRKGKKKPQTSTLRMTASRSHYECVKYLLTHGADVEASHADCGTVLQNAVHNGNLDLVKFLLDWGAKADTKCKCHQSFVMCCVSEGREKMLKFLLSRYKDSVDMRALHLATQNGSLSCLKLLLDNDARAYVMHYEYSWVLSEAAANGHVDCLRLLLDTAAHVNPRRDNCSRALEATARNGQLECLRVLVEAGASVQNVLALSAAVENGHLNCLRFLTENGANDSSGFLLSHAAQSGNMKCLKLLMELGGDVETSGERALQLAAENGRIDCVRTLLEAGACVNNANSFGNTLLTSTVKARNPELLKLLFEFGAQILVGGYGESVLEYSIRTGAHQCTEVLVAAGASVTPTTLEYAVSLENIEVVKSLIESNPLVEKSEALAKAAKVGNIDIVQFLIDSGVDVTNARALETAAKCGHVSIVKLLLEAGAEVNKPRALTMAVESGHVNIVKVLADSGADVNERRVLALAAGRGDVKCMELLIQLGADVNACCDNGDTPLTVAAAKGHYESVEYLLNAGAELGVKCPLTQRFYHSAGQKAVMSACYVLDQNTAQSQEEYCTAKDRYERCIKLLAGAGENVTHALKLAGFRCLKKHLDLLHLLVELGADVNACGFYDNPVLWGALTDNSRDLTHTASILIKAGADVNKTNADGLTAFEYMIQKDKVELVQQVLEAGYKFDPDRFNVLCQARSTEMAALLLKAGAPVNTPWRGDAGSNAALKELPVYTLLHVAGEIMEVAEMSTREMSTLYELDTTRAARFFEKKDTCKALSDDCFGLPLEMIITGLRLSATPSTAAEDDDDSERGYGERHYEDFSGKTYLIQAEINLMHICRKRIRKELFFRSCRLFSFVLVQARCNRTRARAGPQHDHTIWSWCGPESFRTTA